MNTMAKSVFLVFFMLAAVIADFIYNPEYEGEPRIENFRVNVSGEHPFLEWDFLDKEPQHVGFDIIMDPPPYIDDEGKPEYDSTSRTYFTARLLKPYTQYNVTLKTYSFPEGIHVESETLTFKTKPSIPVIRFFTLTNNSKTNETAADLMMWCFADGKPLPEVTIYHNDEPLEADKEYQSYGFTNFIVYYNRTITNYGTYTCNATNIAGSVTKDFEYQYTAKDSGILINTILGLVHETEEIKEAYGVRMKTMETAIEKMREDIDEMKQQIHGD